MFPIANTDDMLAGFYVKEDGRADPVDVTMALAKGARLSGATIIEGVAVTGVTTRRGAVTGVTTTHGDIEAEFVVNCAGMWAASSATSPVSTFRCRPPSTTTSSSRSSGLSTPGR
jgi:4-methylaminobutanoate oxidase (formaldehyde-forming)